jgi:YcxB-like protein
VLLWIGLEMPGLAQLFRLFADPHAELEVSVYEGKVVCSRRGNRQQFRWLPRRGFRENGKFFFLRALGSEEKLAIPKRVITPELEKSLRELVEHEPVRGEVVECRFFLTRDEIDKAATLLHPWANSRYGKLLSRGMCGLSALAVPWIPGLLGKSWREVFATQPGVALAAIGLGLFWAWAAVGCPGMKALNRLDLERRIVVSDLGVEVTCGRRTFTYDWPRLFCYREAPGLFVVRTRFARFWTIPRRALQPGDGERLRSLLAKRLPDR